MRRVQRVCRWDDEGSWEVLTAQDKRAIHLPYTMKAFLWQSVRMGVVPCPTLPTYLSFLEKIGWRKLDSCCLPVRRSSSS